MTAENMPEGMRLFEASSEPGHVEYRVRWAAGSVKPGVYNVTFTASDGKLTDSETITITILPTNQPPYWVIEPQDKEVIIGEKVVVQVLAKDPEDQQLAYVCRWYLNGVRQDPGVMPEGAVFTWKSVDPGFIPNLTWDVPSDINTSDVHEFEFTATDDMTGEGNGLSITKKIKVIVEMPYVKFRKVLGQTNYRWMDIANQLYCESYRNTYSYDNADVRLTYIAIGETLRGTLTAKNLKPNFCYQLKLLGEPSTETSELIGFKGRWWEQEWKGTYWSDGWNLNDKGDGSSPNPNDVLYMARKDIADPTSPTGLKYKYTGYRPFGYFVTDENGNATVDFSVQSCFHVFWKTSQRNPDSNDGAVGNHAFDVNPTHAAYGGADYPSATISLYGEWERLPTYDVSMSPGTYSCKFLLTEESFHGQGGFEGWWAHAMEEDVQFVINSGGGQDTFSISGTVYDVDGVTGLSGVKVSVGNKIAMTDNSGNYTISGLIKGAYTLSFYKSGHTFNPESIPVKIENSDIEKLKTSFVGLSVEGRVYRGAEGSIWGVPDVTVSAGGKTVKTGENGCFKISGLAPGSYAVVMSKPDHVFSPCSDEDLEQIGSLVYLIMDGVKTRLFKGCLTTYTQATYSVSGKIYDVTDYGSTGIKKDLAGIKMEAYALGENNVYSIKPPVHYITVVTDASGNYTISGLYRLSMYGEPVTYTITAGGLYNLDLFKPTGASVGGTPTSSDVKGCDFKVNFNAQRF
ncbi:MAG: hypothetical protein COS99_06710 [Candidatus Omnitrophica bacterium CG07_land_8_20_14_0_80_42_15]|uniref:Uncharacterized protein n=1 Tax=Candidatus Aquitaenariimonas noxiae TaxID=1974741 RepID=A0A2J0KTV7_9BACT|nr:MAG: hypothetical protein COS99_06710 [Candidatus Omnitrophica bacterium CG07_land_8_20_14_0_80_42_15]